MTRALKEWAVLLEAVASGKQSFLLRKGGILESSQGFQLESREFLFFPTWEHQQRDWVRPEFHALFDRCAPSRDGQVEIRYLGRTSRIHPAPSDPSALTGAVDSHIWTPEFLEMRYAYRPDLPLYQVELELFRLPDSTRLTVTDGMRGCRSWVELETDVRIDGARRVPDTTPDTT